MKGRLMTARLAQNVAAALMLLMFVAGGIVGAVSPDGIFQWAQASPTLWLVACAVLMLVSLLIGVVWMNGIDELAQRAHYVAWYWGGSMGLVLLAFLYLASPALAQFVDFTAIAAFTSPFGGQAAGFSAGIATSLVIMTLGYALWWLVFWLRKQ